MPRELLKRNESVYNGVRGRSQTTLTKQGIYVGGTRNVKGMQIFSHQSTVKKLLHKCHLSVGT